MKRNTLVHLLLAVVLVVGGSVGCKRRAKNPTPITSGQARVVPPTTTREGPETVRILPQDNGGVVSRPGPTDTTNTDGTLPGGEGPVPLKDLRDMTPDASFFAANTVYFDFDRSTIKEGEREKIEGVARHLGSNPTHAVRVAGHCDERGTEGYNLSLGERRALAVREYLSNLGVSTDRIDTISYGEAQPAAPGHDELAWKQNRRGEFILLTP